MGAVVRGGDHGRGTDVGGVRDTGQDVDFRSDGRGGEGLKRIEGDFKWPNAVTIAAGRE